MVVKRGTSSDELFEGVGPTLFNLPTLKTGKAKITHSNTLETICRALDCQPGDILEHVNDEEEAI